MLQCVRTHNQEYSTWYAVMFVYNDYPHGWGDVKYLKCPTINFDLKLWIFLKKAYAVQTLTVWYESNCI